MQAIRVQYIFLTVYLPFVRRSWGRLVLWQEGMVGAGNLGPIRVGKRLRVQEDIPQMSTEGFRRFARHSGTPWSDLAWAGLDGRGELGWIDVRVLRGESFEKGEGGLVCWLKVFHREENVVQGPVRTSYADATGEWHERFCFGVSENMLPERITLEVGRVSGKHVTMLGKVEIPVSLHFLDRPEGPGEIAPHCVFAGRAVRVEEQVARDEERWFQVVSEKVRGKGKLRLQVCSLC